MSLLFNKEEILLVNRRLAALIGLNEAIVLQQIHYWVKKKGGGVEHQGCRWVFNTLERWQEQFPFWSQDTVKRALAALKAKGLIRVEKLAQVGRDRTNYYTVDYKQMALLEASSLPDCNGANCTDASGQIAPMDQGNLHSSNGANCTDANKTKTTQETTTKTTSMAAAQPGEELVAPVDLFEQAWQAYPARTGGNSKADARKAWDARLKDGVDPEAIAAGVRRYAAFCQVECKTGTAYVKQAATFFGPGEHWAEEWHTSPADSAIHRGASPHKHAAAHAAIFEGVDL